MGKPRQHALPMRLHRDKDSRKWNQHDRLSLFSSNWRVMRPVDDRSPLYKDGQPVFVTATSFAGGCVLCPPDRRGSPAPCVLAQREAMPDLKLLPVSYKTPVLYFTRLWYPIFSEWKDRGDHRGGGNLCRLHTPTTAWGRRSGRNWPAGSGRWWRRGSDGAA